MLKKGDTTILAPKEYLPIYISLKDPIEYVSMLGALDDKVIDERLKNYKPVLPEIKSGYQKMYIDHVMQADKGADLDFLVGRRGSEVKRHSH